MSVQASTDEATEFIAETLQSDSCVGLVQLEKWNIQNQIWEIINDVDVGRGIDFSQSAKVEKYSTYGLTPEAGEIQFSVNNFLGQYSPGAPGKFADFLQIGDRVRLRGGYYVQSETTTVEEDLSIAGISSDFYYTIANNGNIWPDMNNSSGRVDDFFTDFFRVGTDLTYADLFGSSDGYTPSGYWSYTYDTNYISAAVFTNFKVSANTAGWRVYYRAYNGPSDIIPKIDSTSWTLAGHTINGEASFDISQSKRYLQIAVLFDGITWTQNAQITGGSVKYTTYIEWLYNSVYTLDKVAYDEPQAPNIPQIKCTGHDAYKKANDMSTTLKDLTGLGLDDLVKYLCDYCGILYSSDSIADLSSFGDRTLATGLDSKKKVSDVFAWVMAILNKDGFKYTMYLKYDETLDDNIMFVQSAPALYEADFVFDYRNYNKIGSREKDNQSQTQRLTVKDDAGDSETEEVLSVDVFTGNGEINLKWVDNAQSKWLQFSQTNGFHIDVLEWNTTNIKLEVSNHPGGAVTVTTHGKKWDTPPTYQGEYANGPNMLNRLGQQLTLEIPILISNTEARDVAKGLTDKYGGLFWSIKRLSWPYINFFVELNDMVMMWTRYLWMDDLHFVVKINHHWDMSNNPSQKTSYQLHDSGLNFRDLGSFVYDNDKHSIKGQQILYNTGWVHDMAYTTLQTDADIPDSEFHYDVDEA